MSRRRDRCWVQFADNTIISVLMLQLSRGMCLCLFIYILFAREDELQSMIRERGGRERMLDESGGRRNRTRCTKSRGTWTYLYVWVEAVSHRGEKGPRCIKDR